MEHVKRFYDLNFTIIDCCFFLVFSSVYIPNSIYSVFILLIERHV